MSAIVPYASASPTLSPISFDNSNTRSRCLIAVRCCFCGGLDGGGGLGGGAAGGLDGGRCVGHRIYIGVCCCIYIYIYPHFPQNTHTHTHTSSKTHSYRQSRSSSQPTHSPPLLHFIPQTLCQHECLFKPNHCTGPILRFQKPLALFQRL